MKILREVRRDLIGAAIALGLSGAYWIGATRIPRSSLIGKGVGADALPRGLAVTLAILAVILAAQAFSRWRRMVSAMPAEKPTGSGEETLAEARRRHLRAGGMLLIGIGFLLLVGIIGYIPAIFLMICVTVVYNGRRMSWWVAGFAALLTAIFYALFDLILHIPMPSGLWPQVWRAIAG